MSEVWYGRFDAVRGHFASGSVEHAQRVFAGEGLTDDSVGLSVDAVFGPVGRPWAVVRFATGMGAFSVQFLHEEAGNDHVGGVVSYHFYAARDRYLEFMRDMPADELEARSEQMFLYKINVMYWNDEGTHASSQVTVLLGPDGSARRRDRFPPWGSNAKFVDTNQDPWPGFDSESCWVPVPELAELDALLVPEREQLAVFDLEMPRVRVPEAQIKGTSL